MSYPYSWAASKDLADGRGTATFMVNGAAYDFYLASFSACQELSEVLDIAFRDGKRFAAAAMLDSVKTAAKRRHSELTL
jgi:hypothetical protein